MMTNGIQTQGVEELQKTSCFLPPYLYIPNCRSWKQHSKEYDNPEFRSAMTTNALKKFSFFINNNINYLFRTNLTDGMNYDHLCDVDVNTIKSQSKVFALKNQACLSTLRFFIQDKKALNPVLPSVFINETLA